MGMMNPKIIIPLIWLGCTAAYFTAAFWLPRPDFVVPDTAASGILEIWLHETMRSAPVLIPGFGVLWGVLSGIGHAHASFFMIEHSMVTLSAEHMLVLLPFLSLYMLAQGIMIRRGVLFMLELVRHDGAEEPYHESAMMASAWGEQEASRGSSDLVSRLSPMAKPFLRDVGIFFALLFASATLTFVVWGEAPSSTTLQAFWMYDGMFGYLLALPGSIDVLASLNELDSVTDIIWESLT